MKTLFLEAKSHIENMDFDTSVLPKTLGLVTTIQYIDELPRIRQYLSKQGIKAELGGQVLGCDASAADKLKSETILYIGSGEFHQIGIAIRTNKKVFKLHPESMNITEITPEQIEKSQKKKKGMLLKFHTAKTIGVLLSTKSGQSTVQGGKARAERLHSQFPDKKFYYFTADTLAANELDNFPFIECWLNTMCPRLMEDINVLNIEDIR
jgi:2-(3-amino-3-carboxypropyl)histidine synthase